MFEIMASLSMPWSSWHHYLMLTDRNCDFLSIDTYSPTSSLLLHENSFKAPPSFLFISRSSLCIVITFAMRKLVSLILKGINKNKLKQRIRGAFLPHYFPRTKDGAISFLFLQRSLTII